MNKVLIFLIIILSFNIVGCIQNDGREIIEEIEFELDTSKYQIDYNENSKYYIVYEKDASYTKITINVFANDSYKFSIDTILKINNTIVKENYTINKEKNMLVYQIDDPNWTKPFPLEDE